MHSRPCILLVDDEPLISRLLEARLHAEGYDTQSVTDGKAGVRLAKTAHPDLILLDYRMEGMDGLQVLGVLSEMPDTRDIPVVLLSANINAVQRDQALDLGASYILQKPYDPKTVIETVAAAMHAARPARKAPPTCEPLLAGQKGQGT